MKLSVYNKSDIAEIEHLFTKVFSDSEGQVEGSLIGGLVLDLIKTTDTQNIYGFVAIENNQILGSIIFTKLTFESGINAFILSPVAVLTNHQGKGIGQKLIKFGKIKIPAASGRGIWCHIFRTVPIDSHCEVSGTYHPAL